MRRRHYLFPLAEKHLDVETMLLEVFKNFIFNLIGQSNNNFLPRPIKTHTQVLVHIWEPRARRWLTDGLNQRSIFLCGAGYQSIVFFRTIKSINSLAKSVPMNTYRQIFGYSWKEAAGMCTYINRLLDKLANGLLEKFFNILRERIFLFYS